jgi:transcriptional regulator with XRE-family HTH domain/predicted RNase H-like HicB family nuclease
MRYDAFVCRDGDTFLIEFPDCPGCQTFADSSDEVTATAREALEGWLEAHLVDGKAPPRPTEHDAAPLGCSRLKVAVDAGLAAALALRWARQDAGLTQAQLAERAGVSQQQIGKLENPDENPTVGTLRKVAEALGLQVTLDIEAIAPFVEHQTFDRRGVRAHSVKGATVQRGHARRITRSR